jgi:uncharacterized spore protein YtfJ
VSTSEVWERARDLMTAERVFGQPFEKDGTTIIPVASVMGGGGGGQDARNGDGTSSGSGFGMNARPVGAYVIRDGKVEWKESVDTLRVVLGWQAVSIVGLLALRSMFKQRSKTRRRLS